LKEKQGSRQGEKGNTNHGGKKGLRKKKKNPQLGGQAKRRIPAKIIPAGKQGSILPRGKAENSE